MNIGECTIDGFLEQLGSSSPTPGGGSVSAIVGALAAELCNMVGSLTVGKPKYAKNEEDIRRAMEKASRISEKLMHLAQDDEAAFLPLSKAYSLPKEEREEVLLAALENAAVPPLEIMRQCALLCQLLPIFEEKGSRLIQSDTGCAASLCIAAIYAAALNVLANTKLMSDTKKADSLTAEVSELLKQSKIAGGVFERVYGSLGGKA